MHAAAAFDTYAYVKKLKDVGVPEDQAAVQVEALTALIADRMASRSDLADVEIALKRDNKELEIALKRDNKELDVKLETRIKELDVKLETRIKELEARVEIRFKELEAQIKELEMRLTIRLGTIMVVGRGVRAALVKIL